MPAFPARIYPTEVMTDFIGFGREHTKLVSNLLEAHGGPVILPENLDQALIDVAFKQVFLTQLFPFFTGCENRLKDLDQITQYRHGTQPFN